MKNKTQIVESANDNIMLNEIVNNTVPLDGKDLAILRLLQQNARMSVKEISESVQLSTTPVHERIKRLEASGVIKQYATLIDG
ncbi:MAG: winged helix-turn-helix transcriptional regulator, partial [Sediminibacterium sp.]|nr:winged helix-turn-helix transcriptional regulator [Sediminibacterium sp.]